MKPDQLLNLVTPPVGNVVDVAEMRDVLRLDDSSEDVYLESVIAAATEYVERVSGKQLLTATYELKLHRFLRVIEWPKPPLQSVTSVSYRDASGVMVTVPPSDYVVEVGSESQTGHIRPAYGKCWPSVICDDFAVSVRGTCGFGKKCDVPEVFKQQIRGLAFHWFANRSAVGCGGMSEVPLAITALQSLTQRREFI